MLYTKSSKLCTNVSVMSKYMALFEYLILRAVRYSEAYIGGLRGRGCVGSDGSPSKPYEKSKR